MRTGELRMGAGVPVVHTGVLVGDDLVGVVAGVFGGALEFLCRWWRAAGRITGTAAWLTGSWERARQREAAVVVVLSSGSGR